MHLRQQLGATEPLARKSEKKKVLSDRGLLDPASYDVHILIPLTKETERNGDSLEPPYV